MYVCNLEDNGNVYASVLYTPTRKQFKDGKDIYANTYPFVLIVLSVFVPTITDDSAC